MKNLLLPFILIFLFSNASFLTAQNVSINNSGAVPDASAMLDVSSTTKGMLLPRMTTAERNAIINPAQGLLVYDTDLKSLLFYDGNNWTIIRTTLQDADGDTKIQVEETADEDIIRFDLGGQEKVVFRNNSAGEARMEIKNNNDNLFIGSDAGLNSTSASFNTFLGNSAGLNSTSASFNTFIGNGAGFSSTMGQANTFIGNSAGFNSTSASFNTFLGNSAGFNNSGNSNTFIGRNTGGTNTTGNFNVFIGDSAGFNETGSNKLVIDNSSTSTPLIYGDFATDELTFYGDVGIGTASPQTTLHVAGDNPATGGLTIGTGSASDGGNLRLLSTSNHWNLDNSDGNLRFFTETGYGTGGIERMRILPNGNVAIGISNTSANLHVQGLVRVQHGDDISAIITSNDSPTSSTFFAVNNDINGQAGRFIGDVSITGTLSKSAGTFKIDHPLDPENKYLYHSFVESPDMMNLYNGLAELDSNGEAWVALPEWFEALNMDFRYQLTAIGLPGPNLFIAEKINGNQFKIAGGTAGMEVSWQVTGIRQDPYANTHRTPVEVDKPNAERGFFLHPEVYGKSEEMGIGRMEEGAEREMEPLKKEDN